jgi:enoyl-CoA hydratase/carnithine racemase
LSDSYGSGANCCATPSAPARSIRRSTPRPPARIIGKPLAKELIWTGRRLKAEEARQLRIVNHVAAQGQAMAKARELLRSIGEQGPLSVMFTKAAIERGYDGSLSEGMAVEADAFFALSFSQDRNEGLAAFHEKRAPRFKGN